MRRVLVLLVVTCVSMAYGQDKKSQEVLDKVSSKIKGMNSFYIEFTANIKNSSTATDINNTGKGWVEKNKYYASFGENTIISNGVKTWMVVKEDASIYESDADDSDDDLSPSKIMSIWEKGFKNYYSKEINNLHEIKLVPVNPSNSDYHTVLLHVSKDYMLKKAILKSVDGTKITYVMNKLDENPKIDRSKFVLDKSKYPGYPVFKD